MFIKNKTDIIVQLNNVNNSKMRSKSSSEIVRKYSFNEITFDILNGQARSHDFSQGGGSK